MSERPAPDPVRLAGRRFTGGTHSNQLFARLLGLAHERVPYSVDSVAWEGDQFEVAVTGPGVEDLTFVLGRADDSGQTFVRCGDVVLWYRGETLPAALDKRIRLTFARWESLSIDRLLAHLVLEDDLREQPARTERSDSGAPHRAEVGVWDPEHAYCGFFAVNELELFPTESIEMVNHFVRVSHSDLECHSFAPQDLPANMFLVSFPWITELERGSRDDEAHRETTLSTDLTEHDVIMGGVDKAKRVLDTAMQRDDAAAVILTNTCVPAMTGEDIASLVKAYRGSCRVPLLFHNRAVDEQATDMFSDMLSTFSCEPPKAGARDPAVINLIGFPPEPARDELGELLGRVGVSVGAFVLPRIDAESLAALPRASLNVFLRSSAGWQRIYRGLFDNAGLGDNVRHIMPPAPFGLAATGAWLSAVLEALDLDGDAGAAVGEVLSPLERRWHALRTEAAGYRLGIVVGEEEIGYLECPASTFGVPLIAMLEEIGFGLHFLLRAAGGAAESTERLHGLLEEPDRHQITTFDGFGDMRLALAASDCRAVFSNHTFDWRLSEAGKSRFSLAQFERGIGGAVRTAERLLRLCHTPLYRRYARYLRRTTAGLRPVEGTDG